MDRPPAAPCRTRRSSRWLWLTATSVSLVALVCGSYLYFWRLQLKRFQAVRPGVLYRVGQPSEFGIDYLVKHYQVQTILSLQLFDCRLSRGWFDPGKSDGEMESAYTERRGVRHLQWPMGEEASWPWLTPWQFDEFFKLLDEPQNYPVVVHCMGGRHRTGTFSALFRLEYDRWPVERALAEMYSFDFGLAVPIQEHNLRTYLPRPHPEPDQWQALRESFESYVGSDAIKDYETLVRVLRAQRKEASLQAAVMKYLLAERPFAVPLAQRLIDSPADPLVPTAASSARKILDQSAAPSHDWSMAAAVVADFGAVDDQTTLLNLLEREIALPEVTPRYVAIVAGVTNRYTPNRLPYLRPMLNDTRQHIEATAVQYRYCETAVARLASITDQEFFVCLPDRKIWDDSCRAAQYWFMHHPEACQVTTLLPPTGKNPVRYGDGAEVEDLRRMRR